MMMMKGASGVLVNCSLSLSVAPRPLFPFQPAQYVKVSLLKPAPFCTFFGGLGSAIKSATSLLFFSDVTLVLFSPPCPLFHLSFYLNLAERSGKNCFFLSSCSIRLQWVPGHSFFLGNNAVDELAKQGALLAPSAVPCCLSSLISRIHFCFFSDWRRTGSWKFFDTQVPSISTEELVLPRHAHCVLSRLRCNGHSLLLSLISLELVEWRIRPAAPVDTRPRTPLISFCTVQLRTLCAARSLAILCFFYDF